LVDAEPFCEDTHELPLVVIGWQYFSGIFMVLFKGIKESTCQCCGLHTIEVNLCHTVGQNGSLHWDLRLGWGEVESGVRNDRGMPMAILLLFSTSSTASEIAVSG
jgi:hypothetical protein